MTDEQKDAIYAAYQGICVLRTMCRKANLGLAVERSSELLVELGTAFPFIPVLIAQSALRESATFSTGEWLSEAGDIVYPEDGD
jgi:hypothetical protein